MTQGSGPLCCALTSVKTVTGHRNMNLASTSVSSWRLEIGHCSGKPRCFPPAHQSTDVCSNQRPQVFCLLPLSSSLVSAPNSSPELSLPGSLGSVAFGVPASDTRRHTRKRWGWMLSAGRGIVGGKRFTNCPQTVRPIYTTSLYQRLNLGFFKPFRKQPFR